MANPSGVHKKHRGVKTDDELMSHAKVYDFKRTNRFNKDLIGLFENVYTNYTRILSNLLVLRFGINMKLRLEQISQTSYLDFVSSLSSQTVSAVFALAPMKGPLVLTFDSGFLLAGIDSILGGTFKDKFPHREFTDVEKEVVRVISSYFIDPQRQAWNEYLKIDPQFKSLEFNPVLMGLAPDLESLLVLEFLIEVGENEYPLKLAVPHGSVENVTQTLLGVKRHNEDPLPATDITRALIQSNLKQAEMELTVMLGHTEIDLSQMRCLKEGDVLVLNRQLTDLLPLFIEEEARYYVQPGLSKNKMSVQIVSEVERQKIF